MNGNMNVETRKALIESIESIEVWKLKLLEDNPSKIRLGSSTCPLCTLASGDCSGCPIAKHTHMRLCEGTPYEDAHETLYYWQHRQRTRQQFQDAANKMIVFMEGLL